MASFNNKGEIVSIIGAGRLGSVLGRLLVRNGISVASVMDVHAGRRTRAARELGSAPCARYRDLAPGTTMLFICVPDDAIGTAAETLASEGTLAPGAVVCHTSGRMPSEILAALRKKGMATASFHPCTTFTGKETEVKGIFAAFEGEPKAWGRVRSIADALGWTLFRLSAGRKTLYHAACVMASNYLISLLHAAEKTMKGAGFKNGLACLSPLIHATLEHVEEQGTVASLTGPIVRGDAGTVGAHLEALSAFDSGLAALYSAMGRWTLRLPGKKLDSGKRRSLEKLLETS